MVKRSGWLLGVVLTALLLAGCWYPSVHFDGGNTSFDASNTTLTPAVVNGMQVRFTAALGDVGPFSALVGPIPVNWSNRVIVPAKGKLLSFDAAGVDGCSG